MSGKQIATGSITLVSINDGITICMSPSSCIINADYQGQNQNLENAFSDITLFLGTRQLKYTVSVIEESDPNVKFTITQQDEYTYRIRIVFLPPGSNSGYVRLQFSTEIGDMTTGTFQYSMVKDVNTLDWIMDWETNKTTIGGDYVITPQIFVGQKIKNEDDLKVLSGVYIGSTGFAPNKSPGLYGYEMGKEIFHIDNTGGSIGTWSITPVGIQTADATMQILAEGSIFAKDLQNNIYWGVYKNGQAVFAKGNVRFEPNGDAFFKGKVSANNGEIGGWNIEQTQLFSQHVILDSGKNYIGVSPFDISTINPLLPTFNHHDKVKSNGGVAMYYTSGNDYGLSGYLPNNKATFLLGAENLIAGWKFDNDSIYLGVKKNEAKRYTDSGNNVTIGTNGMRGNGWYIDSDGQVSFVSGRVSFSQNSGTIVGWSISDYRLSNNYAAIIGDENRTGLYLSATNIKDISSSLLESQIKSKDGIYLRRDSKGVELAGYNNGKLVFGLTSSGTNTIGGWKFDNDSLYSGTKSNVLRSFTKDKGSITIGSNGMRGNSWYIDVDGEMVFKSLEMELSMKDNEIYLGSSKIVLDGDVLAKAIETKSLEVRKSTDSSYLKIGETGELIAKGSQTFSSDKSSTLEINSKTSNIVLTSPYSATGNSSIVSKTKVTISGDNGGVVCNNDLYHYASISTAGVYAGYPGCNPYPATTGIEAYAAIVGYANRRVLDKDPFDDVNFIAGVYGRAENTGTAATYGGYFENLKANGLCLAVRQVTSNVTLTHFDVMVSCYNTTHIVIALPSNPRPGQTIIFRQINSSGFSISGNGKKIHIKAGQIEDLIDAYIDSGDIRMLIYDGQYWSYNKMLR